MLPLIAIRAANAVGKPFGFNPVPRAFPNATAHGDRRSSFDAIYQANGWKSAESRSGPGSEVRRTQNYVNELRDCLDRLEVDTVFDAPCGDLNWILAVMEGRHYIGGDISPTLIKDIRRAHPELDLRAFDICTDAFPAADVWHCRDCLFHLPFADIKLALENFLRSGIPYALLTTHRSRAFHRNLDVPVGGWRYLDLEMQPISLPKPLAYLRDYRMGWDFPRYVGLWSRELILAAMRA